MTTGPILAGRRREKTTRVTNRVPLATDSGELESAPTHTETRIAVSPAEAARLAGVGRTTLYAALGGGGLSSFKIGKRRLITIDALRDWLRSHGATL